jgi:glycosyltransferase involved in cell wall biosynthesis
MNPITNTINNKIYVITTYWTYPFGGGEEFMYDTMEWAHKLGMKSYWLAFANFKNETFDELEVIYHDYGTIIHIPNGFNIQTLKNWLYIIKPDIVHHQGSFREKFYMACEDLRIEFLTGFHFWTGGIVLDPDKKNIEIIKNKKFHKTDPEFEFLVKKQFINFYCASDFVQDVFKEISNVNIVDIIYASSSLKRYKINDLISIQSKYVMMINIHIHKGGDVFYYLLQNCPNIHFACVQTEHNSEELDDKIKELIKKRNNDPNKADCLFMQRTRDVKQIYSKTKIMICISKVDETFQRVINESMMNGIPVLTTNRGNIKYLMEDSLSKPINPSNKEKFKEEITKLYFDDDYYKKYSQSMLDAFQHHSEDIAKIQFKNTIQKVLLKSKENNVAIFTPWCDQGLGIQSRNYYKILKNNNFNLAIFALKPYNADTCIDLQKDPDKWVVDNLYYSKNTRETVKDKELKEFVEKYNIGKMLIPETCWNRIFEIAKYLREINVKVYALPNIEIVRRDEIFKHNYFHKILANNYLCENIMSNSLNIPVEYIGYGVEGIENKPKLFKDNKIKFLFIGGMNAFSRKHVLDICEAFTIAYQTNNNIELTITIQMTNLLELELKNKIEKYINHPAITAIQKHIKYSDILNLYYDNHVSIQVSKHEGLGLGFYEGVSTGTPVITLDTPPHNEIIIDNVNGWIIDCFHKKMVDNKDPLFGSAYFHPKDLANKIIEISNKKTVQDIIISLNDDYDKRLSLKVFEGKFISSLN